MTHRTAAVAMLVGPVLVGSLAAAILTVTDPQPTLIQGLPDAGLITRWGLPVARGLRDLWAASTIGLLFVVAVLLPRDARARPRLTEARSRGIATASISAGLWALASAAVLVLTFSDTAGFPVIGSSLWAGIPVYVTSVDLGMANMISTSLVLAIAVGCLAVRKVEGAEVALLLLSLAALWPIASTGHVATDPNHQQSVLLLFSHLVGVSIWIGGLAAFGFLQDDVGRYRDAVLRRYSVTATCCLTVVAMSGVLSAMLRLGSWSALRSSYGALILVKATVLLALGAVGYLHRRRLAATTQTWTAQARRRFAELAGGELVIMCVAVALGVALGRTPPPELEASTSSPRPPVHHRLVSDAHEGPAALPCGEAARLVVPTLDSR